MFLCSLSADVFWMFNRQNTDSPLLHVCFHPDVFILFLCCPVVITQSIVVAVMTGLHRCALLASSAWRVG